MPQPEHGPWEEYKSPQVEVAPWEEYQSKNAAAVVPPAPAPRVASWRDDPYAHFLKSAQDFLKKPVSSALAGGETFSTLAEKHLPAKEVGGIKGMAADATRLAAGLADFAGSPEGFANIILGMATGGASVPFQTATYASASGAELPELAKRYYHERTPENLQNLLTASAFTSGLAGGTGKAAAKAPWLKEGIAASPLKEPLAEMKAARQATLSEKQANNLAAALETGGRPAPGVRTFEDITATDYLQNLRAEAARRGVKPGQFVGRKGYRLAEDLTGSLRQKFDEGYKALVDPIRDRPASKAAKQAALDFANKLESDASFMDAISKTNNLDQVREIANQISRAETIGELDAAREAYNRIGSKYYGKTSQAQYEGSIMQEAMAEGASAIREPLYNEIANNYDKLTGDEIRSFQKAHGKAIQAHNLMRQSATHLSSVESAQSAPHTILNRLREAGSSLTMGRPIHAVGSAVQRELGPKDTALFNTRMRRALDRPGPSEPFKGISPGQPIEVAAPTSPTPQFPMPTGATVTDFSTGASPESLTAIGERARAAREAATQSVPAELPTPEPPKPRAYQSEARQIKSLQDLIRKVKNGADLHPREEAWLKSRGIDPDAPGSYTAMLETANARLAELTKPAKSGAEPKPEISPWPEPEPEPQPTPQAAPVAPMQAPSPEPARTVVQPVLERRATPRSPNAAVLDQRERMDIDEFSRSMKLSREDAIREMVRLKGESAGINQDMVEAVAEAQVRHDALPLDQQARTSVVSMIGKLPVDTARTNRGAYRPTEMAAEQFRGIEGKMGRPPAKITLANPKVEPAPMRTLRVGRGSHGQVAVEFPDALHANLYSYVGRARRQSMGEKAKFSMGTWGNEARLLADRFNMPINKVYEASTQYRQQIADAIKNLPEDERYIAPGVTYGKPIDTAQTSGRMAAEEIHAETVNPTAEARLGDIPKAYRGVSPATRGIQTRISVPGEERPYPASFGVRELDDVHASHVVEGKGFVRDNPKYKLINDRDYKNPVNQGKIHTFSMKGKFDPKYLVTDSPTAENGPPIVDDWGRVLGGNGRVLILGKVYKNNPAGAQAYRQALLDNAERLGIDPQAIAKMKRPVLVRQIPDAAIPGIEAKQRAITDFNKVGTAALTPAERAISDSKRISQSTLDYIGQRLAEAGDVATLRGILGGEAGKSILAQLAKDGVITPQEWAGLSGKAGLTEAGKERISNLVIGRFFTDASQMEATPEWLRSRLERTSAPLARAAATEGWDLTPTMIESMDILEQLRAHNLKTFDDLFRQGTMFREAMKYSPKAITLAKILKYTPESALVKAMRAYAEKAADAGRSLLFRAEKIPTAKEAWSELVKETRTTSPEKKLKSQVLEQGNQLWETRE